MKTSSLPGYSKAVFRDHGPNYLDGKDMEPRSAKLFSLQDQVDRLPVPELKDTIDLYLSSLLPLASPAELKNSQIQADKFLKTIGPELQQRLKKFAEEKKDTSWFQEYWNTVAYLGYRDTIVHNVTYYLQFADEFPHAMEPKRRAARFMHHALKFRNAIVDGSLPPDMKSGNKPRSNTQWKFMFNTCRMPAMPIDFVRTFAPDVFNHIVVARNNRFYKMDVVDSKGKYLGIDQFEAQFRIIVNVADSLGMAPNPIGILSADDRDIWTENKKLLLAPGVREVNEQALFMIESSILLLCFDNKSPVTREELGLSLLHSDGANRFWDKAVQIVFFENGRAGYVGEHAMTDGLTTTRFVNETLAAMEKDSDLIMLPSKELLPFSGSSSLSEPTELHFKVNKEIREAIGGAKVRFGELVKEKELKVLIFNAYGKDQIKKFKCSPDAYIQTAMQAAYYRTFGFCKATYESTQTRDFLHGRTEVTRSCSIHTLNFSRKMNDLFSGGAALGPDFKAECHKEMLMAIQGHSKYIGKASKAHGCDRHLAGLKMLLKPGEDASFFQDPLYARSSHWAMSTSGLVGNKLEGWGFGEVVPDGLGIGYGVEDFRLKFTVTSRHTWAARYLANLEQTLLHMYELGKQFTPKTQSKL